MRLWESLTVREIADPFVVPEPAGTSMRTRLRVTDTEHDLVVEVGGFLGSLRMRDLKRLCAQKALPAGSAGRNVR